MAIGYTPYLLVYGLHPLMLTKYVMSTVSGGHKDVEPTKVLITKLQNWKSYKKIDWKLKTM